MLLADGKQHRNILWLHHMSLAEHGILSNALDNLCQVMAENTADRILSTN